MQIGDHTRLIAPPHHVPGMRAFDFVANAHAAGAQDAAVMIHHEARVTRVHRQLRVDVRVANVIDAQFLRLPLQLAVADSTFGRSLTVNTAAGNDAIVLTGSTVNGAAVLLTGAGRGFCAGADLSDPDRQNSAMSDSGTALDTNGVPARYYRVRVDP